MRVAYLQPLFELRTAVCLTFRVARDRYRRASLIRCIDDLNPVLFDEVGPMTGVREIVIARSYGICTVAASRTLDGAHRLFFWPNTLYSVRRVSAE